MGDESRRIEELIRPAKALARNIDVCMTTQIEFAEDCEKEEQTQMVKELEENAKKLAQACSELNAHIDALEKVKTQSVTQLHGKNGLMLAFKNADEPVRADEYKKHPRYSEFRQRTWSIKHPSQPLPDDLMGEEEELMVVATQKSEQLTCPLTKKYFEDPVRGAECPHIFERSALLDYISKKGSRARSVECAYPGCRKTISEKSLIPVPEILRKIKKRKEEEADEEDDYEQI